jgi:hypothetical protein
MSDLEAISMKSEPKVVKSPLPLGDKPKVKKSATASEPKTEKQVVRQKLVDKLPADELREEVEQSSPPKGNENDEKRYKGFRGFLRRLLD